MLKPITLAALLLGLGAGRAGAQGFNYGVYNAAAGYYSYGAIRPGGSFQVYQPFFGLGSFSRTVNAVTPYGRVAPYTRSIPMLPFALNGTSVAFQASGGYSGGYAGGYMSGGIAPTAYAPQARIASPYRTAGPTQAAIGASQMAAAARTDAEARIQIAEQRAYETGKPVAGAAPPTAALRKALESPTEAEVISGAAPSAVLAGALTLEKPGARPASVVLPPDLLGLVTFAGSPEADALTAVRAAGRLVFPASFDGDALRPVRDAVEKNLGDVATAAATGRTVAPDKLAKLANTVKAAREQTAAVARDLPFEDALAHRRFLNQLDAVPKVFARPESAGLLNPKWAEGATVGDLVKHMVKYKLRFGPAAKGSEEAYLALHRGLVAYYGALTPTAVVKK